jgi:hypothetical protein
MPTTMATPFTIATLKPYHTGICPLIRTQLAIMHITRPITVPTLSTPPEIRGIHLSRMETVGRR